MRGFPAESALEFFLAGNENGRDSPGRRGPVSRDPCGRDAFRPHVTYQNWRSPRLFPTLKASHGKRGDLNRRGGGT